MKFKPGDCVRLKRGVISCCPTGRKDNRTAIISRLLTDVDGGVVMEDDLRGCRYWNVADLEPASARTIQRKHGGK